MGKHYQTFLEVSIVSMRQAGPVRGIEFQEPHYRTWDTQRQSFLMSCKLLVVINPGLLQTRSIKQFSPKNSAYTAQRHKMHKMWSRLAPQICHFFWLITRCQDFCDKKCRILTFRDKKCRIPAFRDKILLNTVLSVLPCYCNSLVSQSLSLSNAL